MINFHGPTTIHTAIDGNAGEVRVTVAPDAAEVARLQARVAELEAALAPLAALNAEDLDPGAAPPADDQYLIHSWRGDLTAGDVRRARALLGQGETNG